MADNVSALTRIEAGMSALADYVHRTADHRADLYTNVRASGVLSYRLDEFIADTERAASRAASAAIGPGATVTFIAPGWVRTALERPLPASRYLSVPYGRPERLPGVWHLLAVATASPRAPRPLLLDWDWCAVFPCVTPDDLEPVATVEARPCAGTCDDGSEAAA